VKKYAAEGAEDPAMSTNGPGVLQKERLERHVKKWTPVFQDNQVYADCAGLSAASRSELCESIAET
jgi:hypothetical protein